MKIRFTNGNEIHCERGIGEALVLGGMATEIVNDGGASTLVRQELNRRPASLAHPCP